MSPTSNLADTTSAVSFAKKLYRACKDAGDAFYEVSREVRGLHTVLRHLQYELEAPESILNRDSATYTRDVSHMVTSSTQSLRQLDELLLRHAKLGQDATSNARLGSTELDQLGELRMKIINHKTTITAFLDAVQLRESGKMPATLEARPGQLDIILDKIDTIAARMGQRAGSTMTTYEDDDKEVWKQFRRELVAEGFSSDVLQKHKDVLRAYIREVEQKGALHDHHEPVAPGIDPNRWLNSVESMPTNGGPTANVTSRGLSDPSNREMILRDAEVKYPQDMKLDIARARGDSRESQPAHLNVPASAQRAISASGRALSVSPQASYGTSPNSTNWLVRVEDMPVISTRDLILADRNAFGASDGGWQGSPGLPPRGTPDDLNRLLSNTSINQQNKYSPPSSPDEPKKQVKFADEVEAPSPKLLHGPRTGRMSPPRSTPIPIPGLQLPPPSQPAALPYTGRLAPDSRGNEIPADAKWTKIRRNLICLEVLDRDGRRYEARPEYVAILGVLSREDIVDLATRSHAVREARLARKQGQHGMTRSPDAQTYVPDQHSSSDSDSEESDSSVEERRRRRQSRRDHGHRPHNSHFIATAATAAAAGMGTSRLAPSLNSHGLHTPPSHSPQNIPSFSPVPQVSNLSSNTPPNHGSHRPGHHSGSYSEKDKHRDRGSERDSDRDRDHHHHRRHRHSSDKHDRSSGHGSERGSDRHRGSDRSSESERAKHQSSKEVRRQRFRDNLTAASLGGAAVSLLSVLTEAAEDL